MPVQYPLAGRSFPQPFSASTLASVPVQLRQSSLGHDVGLNGSGMHSVVGTNDASRSKARERAEQSEEELLQWQPIFPAKSRSRADGNRSTGNLGTSADLCLSTKKATSPAGKAANFKAQTSAADRTPATTHKPAKICSLPASKMAKSVASARQAAEFEPTQGSALVVTALVQQPSMPAASLSASAGQHSLERSSSHSSLLHALHAEPLHLQSSLPLLPQSSSLGITVAAAAPAVIEPASLSASMESDWRAADAHGHRHNISSCSSQASDADMLRRSTPSTASNALAADLGSSVTAPGYAVTGHADTVTSHEATDMPLAMPADWGNLNTTQLHSQTAALLSSLTISTDWDSAATDAHLHRSMWDASGTRQTGSTALASVAVTELETLLSEPMCLGATPAKSQDAQGLMGGAAGSRSPASSLSSSGLLSVHIPGQHMS